jgi:hypothetical protein
MSVPSVATGCVFHWEEYEFEDGEKANKYLVFVGTKVGSNYLAVIATSKPHRRKKEQREGGVMTVYIVYVKGDDWENVEAFLQAKDAKDYLSCELSHGGTTGQIRTVDFKTLTAIG